MNIVTLLGLPLRPRRVNRMAETTIVLISLGRSTMEEAVESVLGQTRQDFKLLIADIGNGPYSHELFDKYAYLPQVDWRWCNQPDDLLERLSPLAWNFNRLYRQGAITSPYFCLFSDDDIYYPNFLESMAGYLDQNGVRAVYCQENRVAHNPDGTITQKGIIAQADHIMTASHNFSCYLDAMQVVMHTSVLDQISERYGGEIIPESFETRSFCDGEFFNRAKEFVGDWHFINAPLCEHRMHPFSTYGWSY